MQQERGFLSDRLNLAQTEVEALRERLRSLRIVHGECEEALRFYGNPSNYALVMSADVITQGWIKDDYTSPDNGVNTNVAGRRAREYFKKHEHNRSPAPFETN